MKIVNKFFSMTWRYLIGIGVVFWLFRTKQLDANALLACDVLTITLVLGLSSCQLVLCSYRVKLLLRAHHIFMSLKQCIIYNTIGIFYSLLLPGNISGDAVRAYYFCRACEDEKVSKAELCGVLITDRFIGTLMLIFLGIIVATFSAKQIGISSTYLQVIWAMVILGLGLYLGICRTHRYNWSKFEKSRFSSISKRMQQLISTLDLSSYSRSILLVTVLNSIAIHMFTFLAIFWISIRLKAGLTFPQLMSVAPVGLLVNALPISPGGLGVGEKSFELLFALVGGQNGGNTFMVSRIFLFAPALLGVIFFLLLRQNKQNKLDYNKLDFPSPP